MQFLEFSFSEPKAGWRGWRVNLEGQIESIQHTTFIQSINISLLNYSLESFSPSSIVPLPKYSPNWGRSDFFQHANLIMANPCFVVVQLPNCVWISVTPWTAGHQAFLSLPISWSLPKFMSIESVMPSNHLILYCPLLLLPSIFPSIGVFSNESALHIRWPKYWSFSFRSLSSSMVLSL